MALVVRGTVLALGRGAEEEHGPGVVWLGDDGRIEAVTRPGQRGPSGFTSAPRLDVGDALVLPGFVDLHSHLGYNMLPLWVEPSQATPFLHHDIWPGEATYGPAVSWPAWTLIDRAPECVFAYVQARALVGGTTAIQGWPTASRPPTNRLVRCVDHDREGPRRDPVLTSSLTLDTIALRRRRDALAQGAAFVYHCAEGQPGTRVVAEFTDLSRTGCLQRGLVAIHGTALDRSHFDHWVEEAGGRRSGPAGTIVWSPLSNLWLYGVTTDIAAARDAGLRVCLGTDWGPSGTKNLLGELKVARAWSDRAGWDVTDHELVAMVTANPGDALGAAWDVPVGRLVAGGLGDLVVIQPRRDDPWASVVAARERDVLLTVVGGQARLGTRTLMAAAGVRTTTSVPVGGGQTRRLALVRPDDPSRAWTWRDVLARLDAVRAVAAVEPPRGGPHGAEAGRRQRTGRAAVMEVMAGDPPGTPPIVAALDMPGGADQPTGGPPPPGRTVDIPPIEPLYHDRRWFSSLRGRGFHAGALDGLARAFR